MSLRRTLAAKWRSQASCAIQSLYRQGKNEQYPSRQPGPQSYSVSRGRYRVQLVDWLTHYNDLHVVCLSSLLCCGLLFIYARVWKLYCVITPPWCQNLAFDEHQEYKKKKSKNQRNMQRKREYGCGDQHIRKCKYAYMVSTVSLIEVKGQPITGHQGPRGGVEV
jgi:hypothetical protein